MNFRRALSVFLVFLAVNGFAPSVFAEDGWIKVRSKNFQLTGNAGETDLRETAVKLEQFREAFRSIFVEFNFESTVPTNVIVFKSDESFRDYKPVNREGKLNDWAAGYFQAGEDVNYIAFSIKSDKAKTFRTIFHEYAHFLIDNGIGRSNVPPWLNEGLAEYYEMLHIENDQKITLGNVNEEHLRLLRQSKLIPPETLFNTDYFTLQMQSREIAVLFYAQAWALIHYLKHENNGSRSGKFDNFLNAVKNGKAWREAFSAEFQTDLPALERQLRQYVNQKSFSGTVLNTKNKVTFNGELQIIPVSKAEAQTILGDLLYHLNRFDAAAARLEEALKLNADSSPANTSLGLVRMRQKNFVEAKKYLEKAIRADEKNYLAFYHYAYVLSRQGMSEYGFVSGYDHDSAEKMREALKKAIELNPDFAQSYSLYAFISVARNEDIEEALGYIKKALSLAPGNQWFLIRSAELYMRQENFALARQIAQKVYRTAPDEALRLYAQNRIFLINSLEAQVEAIKNYQEKDEVPDQPLTDEEFARLRELSILKAINQGLRKPRKEEIRVLGYLTKIVCDENGVGYFVKVDNKIIKLNSKNFDNITLVSFAGEMSGVQIGCETIKKDTFAVITYFPGKNAAGRTAGEIISIEFVPKNFRFYPL